MQWEAVIGLEVHVQLMTQSKIFSGSSTQYGAPPNTHTCAIDLAMPGTLPVMNKKAVELAIRFGLAVGSHIRHKSIFDRKNYFYPDLPKSYQISQYEAPIVEGGQLTIFVGDKEKVVRLTRAHLEEDAGKSVHDAFRDFTGIDLNRGGAPLLEIVSEPDMSSPAEAAAYARTLHELVQYIGICDGNLQEGSFRCDANVSVKPVGTEKLGTRVEIKNLNSFRFLEKAVQHEIERQIDVLESGGSLRQETRLYDADRDETRPMRSKENAHDYRYFPDPDLPPLIVSDEWIEAVRAQMPELPAVRRARFVSEYGLKPYDASVLTSSRQLADYYEAVIRACPKDPKQAANWVMTELMSYLNKDNRAIADSPVDALRLGALLNRIQDGTISNRAAKTVFEALWADSQADVDQIIDEKGLRQISDTGAIEKIIDEVLAAQTAQVEEYRAGKEKAFNFLVGQVMKASKGKGNPVQIRDILKAKLG